jgi:hypothetical protein
MTLLLILHYFSMQMTIKQLILSLTDHSRTRECEGFERTSPKEFHSFPEFFQFHLNELAARALYHWLV